jgi:hypothetical protein
MEVQWLSGSREVLERIPINCSVTIQEGKGIVSQEAF